MVGAIGLEPIRHTGDQLCTIYQIVYTPKLLMD